jgi:digeranylgeranylglycerophospholipid reductase
MINSSEFDVAVVGAGPSGSVAARFASECGLKVILLERKKKPGLKLCAGGLPNPIMRNFDVDKEAIECSVTNFLLHTHATGWHSTPSGGATTTYRTTIENEDFRRLDHQLAIRAEENGAKVVASAEVIGMTMKGSGVKLLIRTPSGDRIVAAKIVLGADGFNSIVAKSTNLWRRYKKDQIVIAVQREVLIEKKNEDLNCYNIYDEKIAKVGYLWIYPKSRGFTIGLGCLASHIVEPLESVLERVIRTSPLVKEIVPHGSKFLPIEGAPIPTDPLKKIYSNNVMLLGDAARHVNPMTWGGIYNAMVDGKLASAVAAEAISKGDYSEQMLKTYQEKWYETIGEQLVWERDKFERVSEKYVKHFALLISLLRNRYATHLANATSNSLSKIARFIPSSLLDKLIMYGWI